MKVKDLVNELSRLLPDAADEYIEIIQMPAPPEGYAGRDFCVEREVREAWVEVHSQEMEIGSGRFAGLDEAEKVRGRQRECWVLRHWYNEEIDAEKKASAEGLTVEQWRRKQEELMRSTVRGDDVASFREMLKQADEKKKE